MSVLFFGSDLILSFPLLPWVIQSSSCKGRGKKEMFGRVKEGDKWSIRRKGAGM